MQRNIKAAYQHTQQRVEELQSRLKASLDDLLHFQALLNGSYQAPATRAEKVFFITEVLVELEHLEKAVRQDRRNILEWATNPEPGSPNISVTLAAKISNLAKSRISPWVRKVKEREHLFRFNGANDDTLELEAITPTSTQRETRKYAEQIREFEKRLIKQATHWAEDNYDGTANRTTRAPMPMPPTRETPKGA